MQIPIFTQAADLGTLVAKTEKVISKQDNSLSDRAIVENCFLKFSDKKSLTIGNLASLTAQTFIGSPYVANTLDGSDKEQLIVNLREFDCTTFIESVVALAQEIKRDNPSLEGFESCLKKLRYNNGEINGYTSRLHYMLDWISNNINNNTIENITQQLGGEPISKKINFMSSHVDNYMILKKFPHMVEDIIKTENKINRQIEHKNNFILLKKEKFKEVSNLLNDGDIVLFATKIDGLDYSHMGFVICDDNEEPKLLHASSGKSKKVIIDPKTLNEYLMDSSNCIGITILRLKN